MVIGIDVGGTKTRAVFWNGHNVIRSAETKTPKHQEKFAKAVQKVVRSVADKEKIAKIGIGAAGVVRDTVLTLNPNIPAIQQFNFRRLWPSSVSIRVDNDARCFARGEYLLGAGFALYVSKADVDAILEVAASHNIGALRAGYIERSDDKKVVIKPKGLEYSGATLGVR